MISTALTLFSARVLSQSIGTMLFLHAWHQFINRFKIHFKWWSIIVWMYILIDYCHIHIIYIYWEWFGCIITISAFVRHSQILSNIYWNSVSWNMNPVWILKGTANDVYFIINNPILDIRVVNAHISLNLPPNWIFIQSFHISYLGLGPSCCLQLLKDIFNFPQCISVLH